MNYDQVREKLIDALISRGYLKDQRVMTALKKVPRHLFVPHEIMDSAYIDCPHPIGFNQTISAPHMVAIMTDLLDAKPDSNILEVGTGSGYQAAVLGELAPEGRVVSVERIPELTLRARSVLEGLGYKNVILVSDDGTLGLSEYAPYDRIIVTAAAPDVPKVILNQLAEGGRMLIPVGSKWSQTLMQLDKDEDGGVAGQSQGGCVFVPLIGKEGW